MAKELTIEEAVERAQRAQDGRINAIRELAAARQSLADTREQGERMIADVQRKVADLTAEAERDDVRQYAAAQAAGWSADELRKIGYGEPDKKKRTRARGGRKPAQPAAPSEPAQGDADSATEQSYSE